MVRLCLVIVVFMFIEGYISQSCEFTNQIGLTYNLNGMIRSNSADYQYYSTDKNDTLTSYFINICANTRENCNSPSTPICKQSIYNQPLPQSNFESITNTSIPNFQNYYPNSTANGVTLVYKTKGCSGENDNSYINILCDLSVENGIIDSISTENNNCILSFNMRSKYGCGYNKSEPLTCNETNPELQSLCSKISDSEYKCQSGDFVVSISDTNNNTKYEFFVDNNYSYSYGEPQIGEYGGLYSLTLNTIFEIDTNGNEIPDTKIDASNLFWNISSPIVIQQDDSDCSAETLISISSTDESKWKELSFINHFPMKTENNDNNAQFEIFIENYTWQSSSSKYLVFSYLVDDLESTSQLNFNNETYSSISNAYFSIFADAVIIEGGAYYESVSAQIIRDNELQIAYSRFPHSSSLFHNIEYGIHLPPPTPPNPSCSSKKCNFNDLILETSLSAGISWIFYLPDNPTQYQILLYSISEVDTTDISGTTIDDVSYSTLYFMNFDWSFTHPSSRIIEDGTAIASYKITSPSTDRWSSFDIIVEISMKNGVSHFEVILEISDYVWISDDISTSLQIEFDIGGPGSISYSFDTVLVGDSYIRSNTFGISKNSVSDSVEISGCTLFYSDAAYFLVPHFEGSFSNYVAIGINTTSDHIIVSKSMINVSGTATAVQENERTDPWWVWLLICIVVLFILFATIFVISFFVHKKYRQNYDSI